MEKKLKILLDRSLLMSRDKSFGAVLTDLMNMLRELLDAEQCSIFLHDRSKRELWTLGVHGGAVERQAEGAGIAGHVFRTGEVLNIRDTSTDARYNPAVDGRPGLRLRTVIAYPLHNQRRERIGVFQVANKAGDAPFGHEDEEILAHFSRYVAASVEHSLMQSRFRKAQEDAIYRLSHATKFKDPESRNHLMRVGLIAAELGGGLGLSREDCEIARLAVPMHDIGKVGVPDHILQKAGPLDREEREVMRRHSRYGHDILKDGDSRLMMAAAQAALEHHERWDGWGYPDGKKGESISTFGRLAAAADVFDALTSKRCYKEAWPVEKAVDHLRRERGAHFDPAVVDVFLARLDPLLAIKARFADVN